MPVTKADLLSLIEDAEQRNFIKEKIQNELQFSGEIICV